MAKFSDIHELQFSNLFHERQLIMSRYVGLDKKEYYDGEKHWTEHNDDENKTDTKKFKGKYVRTSNCFICELNKKQKEKYEIHETIMDCYNCYKKTAEEIKNETKGKVNLFISGDIKSACLKFLFNNINDKFKIEQLEGIADEEEYLWSDEACAGALIYARDKTNITLKKGIELDMNSCYASCLLEDDFKIPFTKGNTKILKKLPKSNDKLKYGFYRCEINGQNTARRDKTNENFVFRKNNYYTHFDIIQARKFNFEIKLIVDEYPNCYYYENLWDGKKVFEKYIQYFYDLKSKTKNQYCKAVYKKFISGLWGFLCEKNICCKKIVKKGENFEKEYGEDNFNENDFYEVNSYDEQHDILYITNYTKPYKTRLARIKPFLMSYARKKLGDTIYKLYENEDLGGNMDFNEWLADGKLCSVYRVHTDGLIIEDKYDIDELFKISDKIGDFKIERRGYFFIEHVNKIIFKEKYEDTDEEA